jgi:hypothetical protein
VHFFFVDVVVGVKRRLIHNVKLSWLIKILHLTSTSSINGVGNRCVCVYRCPQISASIFQALSISQVVASLALTHPTEILEILNQIFGL